MVYKKRYMIVDYPKHLESQVQFTAEGGLKNHFPLHDTLNGYHWSRLDDNCVIVSGMYVLHRDKHLELYGDKVSVLPYLASSKHIHKVVKKDSHWQSLRNNLGLPDEPHTMCDIVDNLEALHGPLFGVMR